MEIISDLTNKCQSKFMSVQVSYVNFVRNPSEYKYEVRLISQQSLCKLDKQILTNKEE